VRAVAELPGADELAALLYRADWTRLSLRADLARRVDRHAVLLLRERPQADPAGQDAAPLWRETTRRVLVAPGGRFRVESTAPESPAELTVCDGESCWWLSGTWAQRQEAGLGDPELARLLDPSWLLAWYQLELSGTAQASGRAAYRVTARPRPARLERRIPGQVDALVDAELGIVVWLEAWHQGRLIETAALQALAVGGQTADLASFSPPPGTTATDPGSALAEFGRLKGPLGQVAGTAADLTASALTFAVRHSPRPAAESPGPPMPRLVPPDPAEPPEPLSDHEIGLLQRAGLPGQNFRAEIRQWSDPEVLLESARKLRAGMRQPFTGLLGPDGVWDALGERVTGVVYRTARLRVAMPGRYRIDFLSGNWQSKLAIAGDGERLQTQYRNRVVTGPAEPLDDDWAQQADPAWLLLSDWQLSGAGDAEVDGRPGLLLWAQARPRRDGPARPADWGTPEGFALFDRIAVIVDAELGILLRCARYVGSRLASCTELAGVEPCAGADPAGFSIDVPPGTRVVEGSSPLAHVDLRRPAEAAKAAGVIGMAGAAIVSGWLQNRPGRRPPPARDE
jgi:outer membrane lipoprotein-sorting protein